MPLYEAFERITTECSPPDSREERVVIATCPFPEPDIQNLDDILSEWRASLLAPLALTSDVGSRSGHDIASAQVDDFRYSQPGL